MRFSRKVTVILRDHSKVQVQFRHCGDVLVLKYKLSGGPDIGINTEFSQVVCIFGSMKRALQPIIQLTGLAAVIFGIDKVSSEMTTLILPVWLIVGVIALAVCTLAAGMAYVMRNLLDLAWRTMTYTSMILIVVVIVYAIVDYKPTIQVIVPENYSGDVKLFVSTDSPGVRKISLNRYGVGYITRQEFDAGFYPRVIKAGEDITHDIRDFGRGSAAATNLEGYSFRYVEFTVPGAFNDSVTHLNYLLRTGGLDSSRIPKTKQQ